MSRCLVCERTFVDDCQHIHWLELRPSGRLEARSSYLPVCARCYMKYSIMVRRDGYPRLRDIFKVLRRIRCQPAMKSVDLETWADHTPYHRVVPKSDWCLSGCHAKLRGGYLDVVPRDIVGIIAEYVTRGRMMWLPANGTESARCLYLCDDCWRAELIG